MHTSKVLWVTVIVLVGSVVQCQRPRPRPGSRPSLRDSMLAGMVRSTMNGTSDIPTNVGVGRSMVRTLDPDGSRAGPARVRRPQRQRGGGERPRGGAQQGRIAITQEEYDYLNNFDYDESFGDAQWFRFPDTRP